MTEVPRGGAWRDRLGPAAGAFGDYEREHPGVIYRAGGASEFRLWLPGMQSRPQSRTSPSSSSARRRTFVVAGRRPWRWRSSPPAPRPADRDYETKRAEYLAFGLLEYWIVDPIERRIVVLVRDGDTWDERAFAVGQVAEGLVLPGFRAAVAELLGPPVDEADA